MGWSSKHVLWESQWSSFGSKTHQLCWKYSSKAGQLLQAVIFWFPKPRCSNTWYIYLHLVDFYGFHVGKYTIHIHNHIYHSHGNPMWNGVVTLSNPDILISPCVSTNPVEKYARQIGSFPQVGVRVKNIWNHRLDHFLQFVPLFYEQTYGSCAPWYGLSRFQRRRVLRLSIDQSLESNKRYP